MGADDVDAVSAEDETSEGRRRAPLEEIRRNIRAAGLRADRAERTLRADPSMNPVRLGAVEYLNARPLVFRLERSPRFVLRFDWPSRCAALLHDNVIDVGLIPSIEYLRAPASAAGSQAYRIVPDLAVASRGPVASVAIYTTRPMADVRSIALDTSSRTSVALTRVLSARVFGIRPDLRPCAPDLEAMLTICDAALIIGDKALLMNGGSMRIGDRDVPVEKIDLGEAWTRETGLPFVYAFWVGRSGVLLRCGRRSAAAGPRPRRARALKPLRRSISRTVPSIGRSARVTCGIISITSSALTRRLDWSFSIAMPPKPASSRQPRRCGSSKCGKTSGDDQMTR